MPTNHQRGAGDQRDWCDVARLVYPRLTDEEAAKLLWRETHMAWFTTIDCGTVYAPQEGPQRCLRQLREKKRREEE